MASLQRTVVTKYSNKISCPRARNERLGQRNKLKLQISEKLTHGQPLGSQTITQDPVTDDACVLPSDNDMRHVLRDIESCITTDQCATLTW